MSDPAVQTKPSLNTFSSYKELPPPIVECLEKTFGNWLNEGFEVGQKYREDFGGYAMFIKVPEKYSTEWKRDTTLRYDNTTRRPLTDKDGNQVRFSVVTPDERWKGLNDIQACIKWIVLVKEHIITNAFKKGIMLPSTHTPMPAEKGTLEEYKKAVNA